LAGLAILVVLPAQERRTPPQPASPERIIRLITRRDVLLPALLAAAAQHINWGTTFGFIPILVERMGGSDITQSILVSMQIGIVMLGHLATTAVEKRLGGRRLVYGSFALLVIGLGIAAFAPTLGWIFAAQFCFGLSFGISYPVLMGKSIETVSEGRRSTAMGLFQAVYAIGMFSGPGISGVLADAIGIQPMFVVTAVAFLPILFIVRYLSPSKS
jgi:MFS family permease